MAAFNEEKGIGNAIDSILSQTFSDWELIVIDDGSTDATADIIQHYADKDTRIRSLANEINMSLPESLNKGVQHARADLIARADADDINLPQRLEKQYAFMQEHPEVDVLGTGAYLLDLNGKRVSAASLPQTHVDLENLPFLKTHFFHPSVIIRRRFFDVVGLYDSSYLRAEDKELWMRGLNMGCHYSNLEEPLIEYITDGYIRSWKSIINRSLSLFRMARYYNIKSGIIQVLLSFIHSASIKIGIYKPKSFRITMGQKRC